MELTKEIHTMIVWSKASNVIPEVKNKIVANFNLLSQIEVHWSKEQFLDNLKVFYSHSQKHRSEYDYNKLLTKKMEHCGDGAFTLFIYEDSNPEYDFRVTSSGNRNVNINVFDCKKELRDRIGGGHKIHASDNTFESNKDLVLLLGLNIEDLQHQKSEDKLQQPVIQNNCIGVDGYDNIEQFFYVLNNSMEYCVIRNYECLPKEYTIEGHGDIDLLVEDLNYIKYLTLAKNYYPELEHRVHYGIIIANELVPFDFRFVGDNYYDTNWQNQILKTSVVFNSMVRVPNTINYFYSLLYHAYVQKSVVKADYFERLNEMSQTLNVAYKTDFSLDKIKTILDEFMAENNYNYTTPQDDTVYFNEFFLNFDASRVEQFGTLISTQQARLNNEVLFTEVYDKGSEIIKFGSELIVRNEIKFLNLLKDSNWVPQVNNFSLEPNNYFVSLEKIKGVQLNVAVQNPLFWKKKNVISFLSQCIEFNSVLIEHQVMHRDIRAENILVNFDDKNNIQLKLIDFGWSVLFSDLKKVLNPIGLGGKYKYAEGQYSDIFSTVKLINYIFKQFQFHKQFINDFDFKPEEYHTPKTLKIKFESLSKTDLTKKIHFSLKEKLLLWAKQDIFVFRILIKIKRALKITISN